MAMLLPASFGASRRMNDSHDIRKNLRYRNAELAQEHPEGSTNEWGYLNSPTSLEVTYIWIAKSTTATPIAMIMFPNWRWWRNSPNITQHVVTQTLFI